MPAPKAETAPTLFRNAKAFDAWLKKHHASSDGLWLQIAKKGVEPPSVTYAEAVEIALCWGWIDGQKKGLDERHFLQRFTPRRARSIWSKVNVGKVAALIEAGRMQPSGQAQVDAAKAFFATINASNRYAVTWRVQTAVKPETRARRIAQLVEMLARGEVIHIFKPKPKA